MKGWESIRASTGDRRRVVYWRYVGLGPGGAIGRPETGGFRAIGYGWSPPRDNADLGTYAAWAQAARRVRDYSEARYAPDDVCHACNVKAKSCGHRSPETPDRSAP